ncbi:MAG: thiamine ABC transporter ATP-binding protein [Rhodospirillaceae bacterium]|nr:thiamine ABC transporter ATP-binding protein [Rhodospirillaceae bacterium]
MIQLSGVRYRYETMVMAYDLTVERGSLVTVIGPSGAGKSTLLNLIAGFDRPQAGRVLIDGQDMTDRRPAARPITMLFQDHNLFGHLTVRQNVGLGIHPGLRLTRPDEAAIEEALARVGLAGFAGRRPWQLSGGERQRVALARSLVRHRPVLLLDEPFAALGPAQRRSMIGLVEDLRTDAGFTVVMVTHQTDDLHRVSGRAIFLEDGSIVADAPTRQMLTNPPHPAVAAYLGL